MPTRPIAALVTLGCKLNLADSEVIARGLREAGYNVVDGLGEAQAVVINTCSVTHVADQKSRRLVRSARRVAPGAAVAITGCYPATAAPETIAALGADLTVGNGPADRERLVGFLAAHARSGSPAPTPAAGRPLRTRAFIAAQAGCNDVCTFCIVPRTRGRERSRAAIDVAEDVARAVEEGAGEAVITGTQLGAWGRDLDPPQRPHELIGAILERTEVPRLRFSSLQPQDITPELLALWSDPRLMPHFHLALQSGSERVLRAMRRRYTAVDFRLAAERIAAAVPEAAITTDVIAGFPGETEEDFEATLALCRAVGFARIHAFPYSPRSRTAAARFPEQAPAPVRKERMERLLALGAELATAFRARFAGTVRPVLWEEERTIDGARRWFGYTDNYIAAYASGDGLGNRVTLARIGAALADGMEARPLGVGA